MIEIDVNEVLVDLVVKDRVRAIPLSTPVAQRSDAELIAAAAEGSRRVAGELFSRHWSGAWRLAWRVTGHRQLADDVAQDAFERAFTALGRFDCSSCRCGPCALDWPAAWLTFAQYGRRATSNAREWGLERLRFRLVLRLLGRESSGTNRVFGLVVTLVSRAGATFGYPYPGAEKPVRCS